jgi:hypothetical protein
LLSIVTGGVLHKLFGPTCVHQMVKLLKVKVLQEKEYFAHGFVTLIIDQERFTNSPITRKVAILCVALRIDI